MEPLSMMAPFLFFQLRSRLSLNIHNHSSQLLRVPLLRSSVSSLGNQTLSSHGTGTEVLSLGDASKFYPLEIYILRYTN